MFIDNIENITNNNNNYREVISTTLNMQLVVMSLLPQQEIGTEIHPYVTQFIRIESGKGIAIINGYGYEIKEDTAIIVPPGTEHNIINTSTREKLKLYSIYSPPNHPVDEIKVYKPDSD